MDAHRVILIRALGIFLPVVLTFGLWLWRNPARGQMVGALLACAWNFPSLLLVNLLAARFGWWSFAAQGGLFQKMPVELYFGWILLWGAIPILVFPRMSWWLLTPIFLCVDLILMPACAPVIHLGNDWLLGEACALMLCFLPAQLLARWTHTRRHPAARVFLQIIIFSSLLLWILPAVILEQTDTNYYLLFKRPFWLNSFALQLLSLPAILGLSAVQEFYARGKGTPVPYDPPKFLVTSGVYSYIANPMQLAMCLLLTGWGAMLGSVWIASAGVMGLIYSAGLAAWDEGADLKTRFGGDWTKYRLEVRNWFPRWRPFRQTSAQLYVAESCGKCSAIGAWLRARNPIGLEIIAAENHPTRDLQRLTYEDGDFQAEGVAAFARALEHINFAWAFGGWTIQLPVICRFAQMLIDVSGGEMQLVKRQSARCALAMDTREAKAR
ncbi:MAG: hypothetical protein NVSMB56_08640 [Pyrinomonadaceae bacterium]